MTISFNLIGAGRLGITIANALIKNNLGQLKSVCNQALSSAEFAVKQLGYGKPCATLETLENVQLLLLTVPDDALAHLSQQLADQKRVAAGTIVVHCSGALSSAILKPLAQQGCHIASVHPLKAFAKPMFNRDAFKNCYCALEGDALAVETLSPLFNQLGAQIVPLLPANKALYHTAATIASNYLVTLAATSSQLFEDAGFDTALAKTVTEQLMQSSLENIQQSKDISDALTGPLARGDKNTLQNHLKALQAGPHHDLYRAMALATLVLTRLTDATQEEIKHFLDY